MLVRDQNKQKNTHRFTNSWLRVSYSFNWNYWMLWEKKSIRVFFYILRQVFLFYSSTNSVTQLEEAIEVVLQHFQIDTNSFVCFCWDAEIRKAIYDLKVKIKSKHKKNLFPPLYCVNRRDLCAIKFACCRLWKFRCKLKIWYRRYHRDGPHRLCWRER